MIGDRPGAAIRQVLQDIRFGGRLIGRSPVFGITGIAIIALGIGAATAIFSVVYGVMLRPLPFHEPERLVSIWLQRNSARNYPAAADAAELRQLRGVFEDVALFENTPAGRDLVPSARRLRKSVEPLRGACDGQTQRIRREVGARRITQAVDRIALGATHGAVKRLVVWQGTSTAITGSAVGLLLALAAGGLMRSRVFEVAPRDMASILGATALLMLVAALASYAPARRAAMVDPGVTLRSE
jgi:hypothetical protein